MIIGINGKIGSGKDTIGNIIQYLIGELDKTDVSFDEFQRRLPNLPTSYKVNCKIKKFAGKLKQIASLLTGIYVEKFEDQEFKKQQMGAEWDMTYREFLQKLGTDVMRDNLHTNVWVNALFADYKEELDPYHFKSHINESTLKYPNWILTDMRFPNELEAVKEREGITIRVVRHQIETANFKPLHPSETALDDAEFDYEIINDGSIDDLIGKVRQILITEKII